MHGNQHTASESAGRSAQESFRASEIAAQNAAADPFGNALGSSLAYSMSEASNRASAYGYENEMDRQSDAVYNVRQMATEAGYEWQREASRFASGVGLNGSFAGMAHPPHDPLVNSAASAVDPSVQDVVKSERRAGFGQELGFKPTEHYAVARTAFWRARDVLGERALSLDDQTEMLKGVQWPDFPTTGVGREADTANPVAWGLRYKLAEVFPKLAESLGQRDGWGDLDLTRRSHLGDLQVFHSTSPDGNLTNGQVRNSIVDKLVQQYTYAQNSDNAMFYIGVMAHPIADSYSGSHTIRGEGGIQQFQNYLDQDHAKHGVADSLILGQMSGDSRYQDLTKVPVIKDAIEHTTNVIIMHKQGATADQVRSYLLDSVFKVDSRFIDRLSGGSAPSYAAPGGRVVYPGR